jgi:hypothetical protein
MICWDRLSPTTGWFGWRVGIVGYVIEEGIRNAVQCDGKLKPEEYQDGRFTITNMGMNPAINRFTAIINPPI